MKTKKVCWISAGISSFMAGYLSTDVDEFIYIDVTDQHPDSIRFIKDCENVLGKEIKILKSSQYKNVEDCVLQAGCFRSYKNGFAPCTNYLKKRIRKEWEFDNRNYVITYVWGLDRNEKKRADNIQISMPEFFHEFPLIDKNLSKQDVHQLFFDKFNFKRPLMYDLGYSNNNCIGCIKGGIGYWNKIRVDFPDIFASRSELEHKIGMSILKDTNGSLYLSDLDPSRGKSNISIIPACDVFCYMI